MNRIWPEVGQKKSEFFMIKNLYISLIQIGPSSFEKKQHFFHFSVADATVIRNEKEFNEEQKKKG